MWPAPVTQQRRPRRRVIDAAIDAFAGTGKPYIHITGVWIYGSNPSIHEESPIDAPAMVAWRDPLNRRVLAGSGMRGVVIVPTLAYGDGGGGVPGLLLGSPRDDAGNLVMIGTGRQHWPTVHVADLANAFRRVLEDGSARGTYIIGDGANPTVAELTEAGRQISSEQRGLLVVPSAMEQRIVEEVGEGKYSTESASSTRSGTRLWIARSYSQSDSRDDASREAWISYQYLRPSPTAVDLAVSRAARASPLAMYSIARSRRMSTTALSLKYSG